MTRLGVGLLAAATVLTGTIATGTAALAAPTTTRPAVYSAEQAGAAVHKTRVHYRFVTTTFKLPDSNKIPYSSGGGLSVQLRSGPDIFVLGISAVPGSDWNAAAVDLQPGNGTTNSAIFYSNGNSPVMKAGDSVTLSTYYNTANEFLYFNATDHTAGTAFSGRFLPCRNAWQHVRRAGPGLPVRATDRHQRHPAQRHSRQPGQLDPGGRDL